MEKQLAAKRRKAERKAAKKLLTLAPSGKRDSHDSDYFDVDEMEDDEYYEYEDPEDFDEAYEDGEYALRTLRGCDHQAGYMSQVL